MTASPERRRGSHLPTILAARTTRAASAMSEAVRELLASKLLNEPQGIAFARENLVDVVQDTLRFSAALGAAAMAQEYARHAPKGKVTAREKIAMVCFADGPTQSLMHDVPFEEAIEDLASRVPKTIREPIKRNYREIAKLYSRGRVIAFVKSSEAEVTLAAQRVITSAVELGIPETDVGAWLRRTSIASSPAAQELAKLGVQAEGWTEKYARMAFRTNASNAATVGQFTMAQDPDIAEVLPAFEFNALADSETRPNHAAADGLVMATSDPDWAEIAPPLEWNCRCHLAIVTRPELKRRGLLLPNGSVKKMQIPEGAYPHPEFRQGPRVDLPGLAPF